MSEVLVLNSGFMALETISKRDAICLLYQNKAYSVVESDEYMRSPSISFRVPTVIALLKYKDFPKRKVGFSKLNVIYRDDMTCQYCGEQFLIDKLTIDHIIPKSRWKEVKRTSKKNFTNWKNTVCACKWCNNKKGNKLLEEAKMTLLREPFEPKYLPKIIITKEKADKLGWTPFCKFNVRIVPSINT